MTTTTITPIFKKGDNVIIFRDWDRKGTVYGVKATVFACGKKKMVLNRRDDQLTCLGRNFRPGAAQLQMGIVTSDMSDEAATVIGIEIAEAVIACELIRYINCLVGSRNNPGYNRIISGDIAALHAPTFTWK